MSSTLSACFQFRIVQRQGYLKVENQQIHVLSRDHGLHQSYPPRPYRHYRPQYRYYYQREDYLDVHKKNPSLSLYSNSGFAVSCLTTLCCTPMKVLWCGCVCKFGQTDLHVNPQSVHFIACP